jgi:NAD(P)-dependent dehydrogenase (short-subunit alcohol dehydrogenase family)
MGKTKGRGRAVPPVASCATRLTRATTRAGAPGASDAAAREVVASSINRPRAHSSPPGPLEETSEEGWRATVDGNLTATFLTIKSVLPGMKERRAGSILTMSSSAGRRAHPRSPVPYAAAKAGIELMTQDIAAQAGPSTCA